MSSQRRGSLSKTKPKADVMVINDLSSIVECPSNTEINEWFAVHIVQFYNELSLLCNIVRYNNVICNETVCPTMCAGLDYEYLWHSREFIQPIAVSAPKYIDFLLEYIEEMINDRNTFPRIDEKNENENNSDTDNENENNDHKVNDNIDEEGAGGHENQPNGYQYNAVFFKYTF